MMSWRRMPSSSASTTGSVVEIPWPISVCDTAMRALPSARIPTQAFNRDSSAVSAELSSGRVAPMASDTPDTAIAFSTVRRVARGAGAAEESNAANPSTTAPISLVRASPNLAIFCLDLEALGVIGHDPCFARLRADNWFRRQCFKRAALADLCRHDQKPKDRKPMNVEVLGAKASAARLSASVLAGRRMTCDPLGLLTMFCAQQDVEKSMQLPTTNTLIDVAPGGPDL